MQRALSGEGVAPVLRKNASGLSAEISVLLSVLYSSARTCVKGRGRSSCIRRLSLCGVADVKKNEDGEGVCQRKPTVCRNQKKNLCTTETSEELSQGGKSRILKKIHSIFTRFSQPPEPGVIGDEQEQQCKWIRRRVRGLSSTDTEFESTWRRGRGRQRGGLYLDYAGADRRPAPRDRSEWSARPIRESSDGGIWGKLCVCGPSVSCRCSG